ncbi:MAG: DUF5312 domain-containing protein [Spirochaetaceae bacterium]|nr:DUF5312 domain-containing protein [Spirochaetaceae bacterium]
MPIKGFEQLSQELPENERKGMLKDLKDIVGDISVDSDLEDSSSDKLDIDQEYFKNEIGNKQINKIYKEVPVFEKIRMFFLKILTKRSIENLVQEYVLKKLGREIDSLYPGLIDIKTNKLKEQFYNEIAILATSFEPFIDTINQISKKNAPNFYRFIASKEMEGFEEILKSNTNPENLFPSKSSSKDSENIKAGVARKFNELVDSIEPEEKSATYELVKALFFMDKLVNFPFESLKKLFIFENTGSRLCTFGSARKLLTQLDSIITSMGSEAIQFDKFFNYLYEFNLTDNKENIAPEKTESPEDISAGMARKGVKGISAINTFKKVVPLTKILKYIYKNVNYSSAKISGGEEWFSIYKKMLKDEVEEGIDKYLFDQKKKVALARLREYIPEILIADSDFITLEHRGKTYPLKKCNSLYYLYLLYEKYYSEIIEKFASKFIIDGLFYKDTNKKELAEAFNLINRFPQEYKSFLYRINHIGEDKGEQSTTTQGESAALLKRKNSDYLIKSFSSEGLKIYKTYFAAFTSVRNVFGGILSGTHSVEYDTISNLSVLCEVKSSTSVQILDKFYRQFHDILNTISEYHDITQQQNN